MAYEVKTIDEYAEDAANFFKEEFPGEGLDQEWSATYWEDLPTEIREYHSWAQFHKKVEEYL